MEIVRRLYERWGRGDAALDLLDPEIEIAMPVGRPDEQRYHGHTGFDGWVEWIERGRHNQRRLTTNYACRFV